MRALRDEAALFRACRRSGELGCLARDEHGTGEADPADGRLSVQGPVPAFRYATQVSISVGLAVQNRPVCVSSQRLDAVGAGCIVAP